MAYKTYKLIGWFGNRLVEAKVVAISVASAKADFFEAYGEADAIQWRVS